MTHHYVYGSGTAGCLYDNGPHVSETLDGAIDSLAWTFDDVVGPDELQLMRANLKAFGIHYFSCPAEAGAQYAEVVRYPGPPEDG